MSLYTKKILGERLSHGGAGFLQACAGVFLGAHFPILLIEEFEREDAAKAVVAKIAENLSERRDSVAGVDAIRIGQLCGIVGRGIVVYMQNVERCAADLIQAGERCSAFVEMKNVKQHACVGAASSDGDVSPV